MTLRARGQSLVCPRIAGPLSILIGTNGDSPNFLCHRFECAMPFPGTDQGGYSIAFAKNSFPLMVFKSP